MKKLILTILVMVAILVSADVSYGQRYCGGSGDEITNIDNSVTDNSVTNEGGTGIGVGIGIGIGGKGGEGGKGGKGGNAEIGDITINDGDVTVRVPVTVNDGDVSQNQGQDQNQDQDQGQLQGQNQSNKNTIIIQDATIPAPLMQAPGFLNASESNYGIWTNSKLVGTFSIRELCRIANPSRALGLLWYEWTKSFQIEMSCQTKAKRTSSLQVFKTGTILPVGLTPLGGAHARALELHKSERQVAAALGVYATMQGADVMVVKSFSNPVTKSESAVIGGAGASVTGDGSMINSAGGFGWATAEQMHRSFVVVELYRYVK